MTTTQIIDRPSAADALNSVASMLREKQIIPYVGPGLSGGAEVPMSPEALADFLGSKVTLPARARGNAWAAAQYIESYKHRNTLAAFMAEAFATPVVPHPFHQFLVGLDLPLIVDSWYTSVMRHAFSGKRNWAEVQGTDRTGVKEFSWFRFYDPDGREMDEAQVGANTTLVYAPHGGVLPNGNFLISDADYVEVLTEIDIQTPIPEVVRQRRAARSFLFVGCHFHDQLLRTYARQIAKRSSDTHYAILDGDTLTRNEKRFLEEMNIVLIDMPMEQALTALMA